MTPAGPFQGKTVLITGASYGIGKAFAEQLAAGGARLVLTARSKDKLETLAQALKQKHGTQTAVIVLDLSKPGASRELYDRLRALGVVVDILINNAGFGWFGRFKDQPLESVTGMMGLNVQALTELTRLYLPGMIERGGGMIMNVASTAAFQPMPYLSLYAATKAFVLSFSEALWGECEGTGVRVLCLCPGNTVTEFHEIAGIDTKRRFLAASAEDLAAFGLKVLSERRSPTAVHGLLNTLLSLGYRFAPRSLLVRIVHAIYGSVLKKTA